MYLPLEDLSHFGVRPEALRGPLTPELQSLLESEAARAWDFYREGVELIPLVQRMRTPRCGRWRESTAACCAGLRRAGMMFSPNVCG